MSETTNLCVIGGNTFDVLVTGIREYTEIIEGANSGVALSNNREIRDITGIKISHAVSFAPDTNPDAFEALYNYLFTTIRPSVPIKVAHGQKMIEYEAAYNTCDRGVVYRDENTGFVGWDELTIEFRPIENQINREG